MAATGQHETSRALADAVRAAFTRSAPPPRAPATDADSSLKRLLDLLRDTSCFGGQGPAVDEGEDVAGGPWRER